MSEAALLRQEFQLVHQFLDEAIVDDRAAAPYARVTVCEDVIINGVLGGGKPLALSTWRGQTGLSELPPIANPRGRCVWASRVRIESEPFRGYASAVHAATDAYLAELDARRTTKTQIRVLLALLLKVSTSRAEVANLHCA